MDEDLAPKIIAGLVILLAFQEIRFRKFRKAQNEMNSLFCSWIQADYQEGIDEKFVEIVEEDLGDLGDLG